MAVTVMMTLSVVFLTSISKNVIKKTIKSKVIDKVLAHGGGKI